MIYLKQEAWRKRTREEETGNGEESKKERFLLGGGQKVQRKKKDRSGPHGNWALGDQER